MRPEESFVGQSVRGLQTMLRVIAEADGTIPTVIPDGIYGSATMNVVSAFQRRYGIPPTGITDQATWDRIVGVYEPALDRIGEAQAIEIILEPDQVFRRGDRSPYLYLLQAILLSMSNDYPSIDAPEVSGTLDGSTAQALAAFQLLAGLPPTGELDRITWKYLAHHFSLHANHFAGY
ncbi:MAG: peptidoglycan-binding protein [Oscillospiraceae bacterium]|nr:peptidoglycan-binding protein [Oscillospiraceae bacterium]